MDGRIGGIVELAWHHRAGRRLKDFLRLRDSTAHALLFWRQDQFCAQISQHLATLDRHGFRHGQYQAVSPAGRRESEADAGIAGRWLNQNAAGLQLAVGFQLQHHVQADPVFHAGEWIEEFAFEQQVRLDAFGLGELRRSNQRR